MSTGNSYYNGLSGGLNLGKFVPRMHGVSVLSYE